MSTWVLEPHAPASAVVRGCQQAFAVNRVFCIGRNYPWPGDAAGAPLQKPLYFMKPASCVVPAEGELPYPPGTAEFCPEIELVAALGRGGRDISPQRALEYVWGYAAGLDLTRRDLQKAAKAQGQSWEAAKAFDAAAPLTPLVPASLIGHPARGAIWLRVNGIERQRSDLSAQLWSLAEVISQLSSYLTLQPGDLIMTGTPAGVEPLQPGDTVQAGIEGIASLQMTVGPHPLSKLP